ncbi:hypothetical protein SMJ63A_60182 [Stenotrophomonas geniculata]
MAEADCATFRSMGGGYGAHTAAGA